MKPIKYQFRFAGTLIMIAAMALTTGSVFAEQTEKEEKVIKITVKKFEYSPKVVRIKKGVPVVLELTSLDRLHGFNCPELGVRTDVYPGKVSRVRIAAKKAGTYRFYCDIFCGEGHEDLTGEIIVEE